MLAFKFMEERIKTRFRLPLSKKRKLRQLFYPVLLASITFLTTLISTYYLSNSIKTHENERFENLVHQIEQQIIFRMETYINALTQTKSMFEISENIERNEFRRYIESLNILKAYPGIQGIGFTEKVTEKDLKSLTQKIRSEGVTNFKVWPENKRSIYYPIVFIEPYDWRNQRAIGFDMHTEEIRSEAMDKAMLSGLPAASGRVTLVQESHQKVQPGFLIYSPIYKINSELKTPQQRKENLIGFIHAPFRTYDLFNEIFAHVGYRVPLKLNIDSTIGNEKYTLYELNPTAKVDRGPLAFQKTMIINVAQREWKISVATLTTFPDQSSRYIPLVVFLLGTLVSCLIFWIVLRQIQFSARENARAAQLEILNNVGRKLSAELEWHKLIQFVIDAGRIITDAHWGAYYLKERNGSTHYQLCAVSGGKQNEFRNILYSLPENFINQLMEKKNSIVNNCTLDHTPLKSYLSVSVISRNGEIIGGIFYGDDREGHFNDRDKSIIEGIAAQAAIAIDNAHLFKSATDAIKVRDEFLSVASHELKTPITSLKLQFQQAARMILQDNHKVYDRDAVDRRVKKAVQQLDRMNSLIEDMLDASRASLSKMTLNKTEFDLNDLTSEIIDSFAEQLTVQKIPYTFEKCPEGAPICGDSYRLEQLISNLISNAIKYGKANEINIKITENDGMIELSVRDHGLGIPSEKLDKIFERYERAVTGSNISGLGLGLYISSHIAQSHNGKILVESKMGQGSTFTFVMPKKKYCAPSEQVDLNNISVH